MAASAINPSQLVNSVHDLRQRVGCKRCTALCSKKRLLAVTDIKITVRGETSKVGNTRKFVVKDYGYFLGLLMLQARRVNANAKEAEAREFVLNELLFKGSTTTAITPRAILHHFEKVLLKAEVKNVKVRNRVARLMRAAQIKSVRGYKRPRYKVGKPALVAPNQLQRQFQHDEPDQAWVTDITYIRTHEGWLYLAAVLDLHSRAVVGWSMGSRMQTGLVLDALTMAVWRRRPKGSVIIHSDQGSQFGSDEFNRWCKDNRLSPSMSRRGNCWDNAVAESFFSNLKSEQIKKRIYSTRAEAKSEIFDYIEGFYNRVRRHKHLDQLSPYEFEMKRQTAL